MAKEKKKKHRFKVGDMVVPTVSVMGSDGKSYCSVGDALEVKEVGLHGRKTAYRCGDGGYWLKRKQLISQKEHRRQLALLLDIACGM